MTPLRPVCSPCPSPPAECFIRWYVYFVSCSHNTVYGCRPLFFVTVSHCMYGTLRSPIITSFSSRSFIISFISRDRRRYIGPRLSFPSSKFHFHRSDDSIRLSIFHIGNMRHVVLDIWMDQHCYPCPWCRCMIFMPSWYVFHLCAWSCIRHHLDLVRV